MEFSIYRFNPETDTLPKMQRFTLPDDQVEPGMMLLDALLLLKEQDDSLGFRRSCQHGVCGSDGMNINGMNGLACITPLADLEAPVTLRPFPGMPVIRDLIVDMGNFWEQYRRAEPWLVNDSPEPESSASRARRTATSWTGCTNASCAAAVPPPVRRTGGIRTSSSARPHCCRPRASSRTAATRPPITAWLTWTTPGSSTAATPS